MFCLNEFAFTVQVKHKNSIQILGFILICLYFTTGHLHPGVLCEECSLLPFYFLAQFSATVSFVRIAVEYGSLTLSDLAKMPTETHATLLLLIFQVHRSYYRVRR